MRQIVVKGNWRASAFDLALVRWWHSTERHDRSDFAAVLKAGTSLMNGR
jgi:hypothetical protein